MIDSFLEPGALVRHPDREDWGLGQVQTVIGHRVTVNFEDAGKQTIDASKVALVGLVDLLRDEHAPQRVLDVQWVTPHLASLGVVGISRAAYLSRARAALDRPLPAAFGG